MYKTSPVLPTSVSDFLSAFFPNKKEPIWLRRFDPKDDPDRDDDNTHHVGPFTREMLSTVAVLKQLREFNQTQGLYYVVNAGGPSDKDILRFNAFFAESDKVPLPEQYQKVNALPESMQPSILVLTKRSLHLYWLIEGSCTEAEWRDVQRRLIDYFDGDPQIKNPSRVMRLPFFHHLSQSGGKRVVVDRFEPERKFTVAKMREFFPEVKDNNHNNGNKPPDNGHHEDWQEVLSVGVGDRHNFLKQRAAELRNKGLGYDLILGGLKGFNAAFAEPKDDMTELEDLARYYAALPPGKIDLHSGEYREPEPAWKGIDNGNSKIEVKDQPRPLLEPLPAFMERVSQLPPAQYLMNELIIEEVCHLFHGQPRAGKTYAVLEILLALATGTPAFGLERLSVPKPVPVAYFTEEDPERQLYQRLKWMLEGRGLTQFPDNLFICARRGLNIDEKKYQDRIISEAKDRQLRLSVIDPFRAFTSHADQGPAELKPVADFIRRFQGETGCSPTAIHHDSKPLAGKADDRRRPQRASGGGIFSIADAPFHCERHESADGTKFLVVPSLFKFSAAPPSFYYKLEIAYDTKGPGEIESVKLVGKETGATDSPDLMLRERVIDYVRENRKRSGNSIVEGLHAQKDAVLSTLNKLEKEGILVWFPGARKAKLWDLKE